MSGPGAVGEVGWSTVSAVATGAIAAGCLAAGALSRMAGPRRRPATAPTARRPPSRGSRLPTRGRSARAVVAVLAATTMTVTAGPAAALAAAATVLLWRRARPLIARRRAQQRVDAAIPDVIELLVLTVRAGMTVHQAVRLLAERAPVVVRPGFAAEVHLLDRGTPLADALRALPDTLGRSATAVVDTLGPADRYGLPLAPALEQLARDARQARRRLDEADARRLPVRMSFPLVTCTLPAFVLLAIAPVVLTAVASLRDGHW